MIRHLLRRLVNSPSSWLFGGGAGLLVAFAALRVFGADAALPSPASAGAIPVPETPHVIPPHPPAEALAEAPLADPFRPDRSPPPRRYTVEDRGARSRPAQPGQVSSRTTGLRLRGTALGKRSRLALIEDSGNRRGLRIYSTGDSIGVFVVGFVSADSVVLAGPDTMLTLMIERPWK